MANSPSNNLQLKRTNKVVNGSMNLFRENSNSFNNSDNNSNSNNTEKEEQKQDN